MSQIYLLDTNMVSYIATGRSLMARERLAGLRGGTAGISAITEGEILYGLAKANVGPERRRGLEWLLSRLQIHPWGREAAAAYGLLSARQEAAGQSLGPLDTQIAAHAIALNAILVTRDGAFQQVTELKGLENWATDLQSRRGLA